MIETTVIQFLSKALTVPVSGRIPANPPQSFVIVRKRDSERADHIDTALIELQCYAASQLEAAELSQQVQAAIDSMVILDNISCCEFGGDYDDPDTENKRERYTAMYNITYF